MAREYHCLIAGLPDLVMDDKKQPLSLVLWRDLMLEELHPKDLSLVNNLFLTFDHKNILNRLFQRKIGFERGGIISESVVDEISDKKSFDQSEGLIFPKYMTHFLDAFYSAEKPFLFPVAERLLLNGYYRHLESLRNTFVKDYAYFERMLRNVLVALTGRKFNLTVEHDIIGIGDEIETLKKSNANDFGLGQEFAYIDEIISIHETENLLEREMMLDALRWKYLDEATFFHYFTIERIIAFTIKVMMVDRWLKLDFEKGLGLFKKLLYELERDYEFPEEYKVSHGKRT